MSHGRGSRRIAGRGVQLRAPRPPAGRRRRICPRDRRRLITPWAGRPDRARERRRAPTPRGVLRGYATQAFAGIRRVGVGYTPGPEAGEALTAAVGVAARAGAALHLLGVVEASQVAATLPLGWGFGELEATKRDDLTRGIGHAIEDVAVLVDISGQVVDGYADDELARLSQEVDLLICGSRGQGRIGNVTLGDASTGLLRKAECPVLVVPRGARGGLAALRAPVVEPA
jgi:nucleotide-binding universal stress UspA family protein